MSTFFLCPYDSVPILFCRLTHSDFTLCWVYKQFDIIAIIDPAQAFHTELNASVFQGHGWSFFDIKEIQMCDFKAPEIKVAFLNFNCCSLLIHRSFWICGGRCLQIILFLKPAPSGIDNDKSFEQSFGNDTELRKDSFVSILGIIENTLNSNEIIPGDNGFMLVKISAARPFSTILDGSM